MKPQLGLAWAAGFFDGEGSTRATHDKRCKSCYIRIALPQIHREVLDRFQGAVGGKGKIYGPYKIRQSPNQGVYSGRGRQPLFYWCVGHKQGIEVINLLWPYLSTQKRIQATKALIESAASRGGQL
jgi:hypothetical protein